MKIVIVPASVLASEDKWTAESYVRNFAEDARIHAAGVRMIQQGMKVITTLAKTRREVRERRRRLGIKEVI